MPKILLLTANIGSYDKLVFKVPSIWDDVYQIIFSSSNSHDNKSLRKDNSLTIFLQSKDDMHRDISRIIKINPLFLFDSNQNACTLFPNCKDLPNIIKGFLGENFDYVVWHDANCLLRDRVNLMHLCSQVPVNGWGIFHHPDRDCMYKEARAASGLPYVNRAILYQQLSFYRSRGMPKKYGLYSCNFFIRSLKSLSLSQPLWQLWLSEYLRWVPRDQISLPYCLFQNPLHRPVSLGMFSWANEFFTFNPH